MNIVFFFGCFRGVAGHHEAGHYWRLPDGRRSNPYGPFGSCPDGTLCPKGNQYQGKAWLHHKDGWTAIGLWDRTGDARGNSNSNFIVEGTYTFDEMCELIALQWLELWERIGKVEEFV